MFLIKKLIFKFMELGLGLRTCFSLETRDPIFLNFKLSADEASRVQSQLPPGFTLQKIRFFEDETTPEFWISYNLYHLEYPKKELRSIQKVRCEINTLVQGPDGRPGVYVFCDSPYVSKEKKPSIIGFVCDLAERMVCFIYGCGRLISFAYRTSDAVEVELNDGRNKVAFRHRFTGTTEQALSDEYCRYNDISFFNRGKTYDLVNVNSAFLAARFVCAEGAELEMAEFTSEFLRRRPDRAGFHRGTITYTVASMNRYASPEPAT